MAERDRQKRLEESTALSFGRAVAQATTARESLAPAVIDNFIAKMGGAEAYAETLKRAFDRVRGEGLNEEEQADFKYRPQVEQRYHQMLLGVLQKNDEFKAHTSPLNGLDAEDLRGYLLELALTFIEQDEEFRYAVFEAIRNDDRLMKRLLGAQELIEVQP